MSPTLQEGHEATLPVPVHKGNTVNRIDAVKQTNQINQTSEAKSHRQCPYPIAYYPLPIVIYSL